MNPKSFSLLFIFFVSFKFQLFSQIIYVNDDATGLNNGTSWLNAYTNLETAISSAVAGNQIWVAKGIYYPTGYHNGFQLNFQLKNGVEIYGSFIGSETDLMQRTKYIISLNQSILSGSTHVIYNFFSIASPLDNTAILDGFVISDGQALSRTSPWGGGIYNYAASPTLRNLIITNNTSVASCSGMFNNSSSPILTNVIFTNNIRGAVCNVGNSSPTFINCLFNSNGTQGAISQDIATQDLSILNCTFYNEVFAISSVANVNIKNSIFKNNNTEFSNSSILNITNSSLQLANNSTNYPTANFPNITSNNNFFELDPKFVSSPDPDGLDNIFGNSDDGLILSGCSPLIDKGDPFITSPTQDIIGANRIGIFDIGVYENNGNLSNAVLPSTITEITKNQPASGALLYSNDCNSLITKITTNGSAGGATGNITAKVWIENTIPEFNGQPYLARHYEITPSQNPNTSSANLTLYFNQSEFDAFNNHPNSLVNLPTGPMDAPGISNLKIIKYSGTSSDGSGKMSTYSNGNSIVQNLSTIWNYDLNRWEISFNVTGFSGFFIQTTASPLPVKLVSFNVKKGNNQNTLVWETSEEKNFSQFEIEKSESGTSFSKIGTVKSNNSLEKSIYSFIDPNPSILGDYYRLKMIDIDGKSNYSKIIFQKGDDLEIKIGHFFPNPVKTDVLNIEIYSSKVKNSTISIFNITGKKLKTEEHLLTNGNNVINFHIDKSSKIQFISIEIDGKVNIQKVLVE